MRRPLPRNTRQWFSYFVGVPLVVGLAAAAVLAAIACGPKEILPPDGPGGALVPLALTPVEVKGYLVVTPSFDDVGAPGGVQLHVPDVDAWLQNMATQADSDPVRTDLSGRFHFPAQVPGTYQLCWKRDGFIPGCGKAFTVSGERVHLGQVPIRLAREDGFKAFFGKVRFADGGTVRTLLPFFEVNALGVVADPSGNSAFVDNFGWYLLPKVPLGIPTLVGSIEKTSTSVAVPPALATDHFPSRVDLVLANHEPTLAPLAARNAAGEVVRTGTSGDVLELEAVANDLDGHPLTYHWRVSAGGGTLSAATGPAVEWKLPATPGRHWVTVLAHDGFGGYKSHEVVVSTTGDGVTFSGLVRGNDGALLGGARVSVAGQETVALAGGRFRLNVPERGRYVLNIHHPGYAPVSRVYTDAVTDGRWTLARAQVATFPHEDGIRITHERRPEDCLGPPSARIDWRAMTEILGAKRTALRATRVGFDRQGRVIRPRQTEDPTRSHVPSKRYPKDCGPGITVEIPPMGVVLADGSALGPNATIQIAIGTVDLGAPDAMPGDYTAATVTGAERFMQSFGAGYVELSSGGKPAQLSAGSAATIEIPIPPDRQGPAFQPQTKIPVLSYEPSSGLWRGYQTAGGQQLMADLVGNQYQAKVSHFSAVNMDEYKSDPACIAIDASEMPDVFTLEMTVLSSSEVLTPIPSTIQNSPSTLHALYNLPPNEQVEIRIYDNSITELGGNTLDPGLLVGTYEANTGAPYGISNAALEAQEAQGYPACGQAVQPKVIDMPDRADDNAFLSAWPGLFGASSVGSTDVPYEADQTIKSSFQQSQAAYYETIDPCDERATLTEFRNANGFASGGVVRAVYANTVDLGFGREMYCRKSNCDGGLAGDVACDVACYVSNYGQGGYNNGGSNSPTPDNDDFLRAATGLEIHALLKADPGLSGVPDPGVIATVAMEYTPFDELVDPANPAAGCTSSGDRLVKFYVYDGAGNLVVNTGVNLDGFGERAVPQLCTVCHGGSVAQLPDPVPANLQKYAFEIPTDLTSGTVQRFADARLGTPGARFIPFDLESFTFVDDGAIITYVDANNDNAIDFADINEVVPRTVQSLGLDRAGQEPNFFELNKIVLRTSITTANSATTETIEEMYPALAANPDAGFPGNQAVGFVVPGWEQATSSHTQADNELYYKNIIAKSCRTCHISQASSLAWNDANFSHAFADSVVCDSPQVMPHAYATWERFWRGIGGGPEFLQAFDSVYSGCTDPLAN